MCGIAGFFSSRHGAQLARNMQAVLAHRGPDDEGIWGDVEAGLWLAHRRLSIIDLSPAGHQPMASSNDRYVAVYNGEIYNHLDLRAELENSRMMPGQGWRGHSDTETLLECIAAWGLSETLRRCVGMFALALWDRQERTLHLARDRFGEKPLYYGWVGGDFAFASELKAIRVHPDFANEIDRGSLHLFATRGYVPAPRSIYRQIYKLEPGSILSLGHERASNPMDEPPSQGGVHRGLTLQRYWSYADVVAAGLADPIKSEKEALDELDLALSRAINGQALADVPVGAFLSGGIDSSSVVAFYQKHSSVPVRTFSIGFDDPAFNEAEYAKEVARHFGTIHNECYVTEAETRDVIPLLPRIYDEPFADSSQIPTYLVSRFAREQVTVALSGDGADELFAGYRRHFAAPAMWHRLNRLKGLPGLIAPPLSRVPPNLWNLARGRRHPEFGTKVQKALRIAGHARSFDDVYSSFVDEWYSEPAPVRGGAAAADPGLLIGAEAPDVVRTMYRDAVTYLPDDILCKVDRAAMAVSLETRVPFLDHRVAEIAARIPMSMKVRDGQGKHILRSLLYREAPAALFERPKAGFAVPVGEWLRGPLRDWAEDLLDERRLESEGWFNAAVVRRRWREHLSRRRESTSAIWGILMFQAWLRESSQDVAKGTPAHGNFARARAS